jgi:hypothetical protein
MMKMLEVECLSPNLQAKSVLVKGESEHQMICSKKPQAYKLRNARIEIS